METRRTIPIWTLILLVLWPATGLAAEPRYRTDGGRIGAALAAGEIDAAEALWLRAVQYFEPEALPPGYRGPWREGFACGTGLVMDLQDRWGELTPAQQAQVAAWIGPASGALAGAEPTPPSGDGRASETCWGQYGANRILGEHFSVEWDEGVSENDASKFLDALEHSWEVEFEQLGWRPPEGSDQYLIMAYIDDSNYAGAYTSVEMCNGKMVPYIVAGEGSFGGGGSTWYMDMAGHELNHASQFGYGFAHQFWWWEATATYIEEQIYPTHDAWASYVSGYSEQPWMEMIAESQQQQDIFYHMYGMCILGFHLDNHVAGSDLVRQTWEESQAYPGDYGLAIYDLLEDMGYDWLDIYRDFMAVNTVMDYDEQSVYPPISLEDWVDGLPAEGQGEGATRPQALGQNYVRISPDAATAEEPDLWVEFSGDDGVNWMVLLVGTLGDRVEEVVELDWLDTGEGEGRLVDLGRFDDAFLVVSPLNGGSTGRDYAWTAEAIAAVSTGDDDGGDEHGDGDDGGGGCSCRQAPTAPGAAPLLIALLAAAARLRRR